MKPDEIPVEVLDLLPSELWRGIRIYMAMSSVADLLKFPIEHVYYSAFDEGVIIGYRYNIVGLNSHEWFIWLGGHILTSDDGVMFGTGMTLGYWFNDEYGHEMDLDTFWVGNGGSGVWNGWKLHF